MWNEAQQEAINTVDGAVQVISVAGSGKSTCLKGRVEHMVNDLDIDESEILIISFTNATAAELRKDLDAKLLLDVTVGTFHSICKKLLEEAGVKDLMNQPSKYKVKRYMEQHTGIKNVNIDDVLSFIGFQQAFMVGADDEFAKYRNDNYSERELRACYKAYDDFKQKTNTYDFGDWLMMTAKMYESKQIKKTWKYVLCDEFQDLNVIQHNLLKKWGKDGNIFAVGDICQSIYEWNGSYPTLFANFHKEFPDTKIINMNINYRSTKDIVDYANNFIRTYAVKYGNYKDTIADNQEDGHIECHVFDDYTDEANAVVKKIQELVLEGADLNKMTVLYRNNANADIIESRLKEVDIEYTLLSNQSFFDKKEIKGLIALLRLAHHSSDDEAFEICMKDFRCYPLTYFRGDLLDALLVEAGKHDCSLMEALMDHKFDLDWQERNRDMFVDFVQRLKMQAERHLSVDKILDNAIKMFKVVENIQNTYESNMWDDKIGSINNLKAIAKDQQLESFLNNVMKPKKKQNKKTSGVVLRTIHSAKGLQSEYVFLVGLADGKFPSEKGSLDEEAHIMYVAVTRAERWQWVSSIGYSQFYEEYTTLN